MHLRKCGTRPFSVKLGFARSGLDTATEAKQWASDGREDCRAGEPLRGCLRIFDLPVRRCAAHRFRCSACIPAQTVPVQPGALSTSRRKYDGHGRLRHNGNLSPRAHQAKTPLSAQSNENSSNRVPKTYPRQAAHRLARKAKHIRRGRVGRDRHRTRASVSTRWSVRDSEAYKG